MLLAAEHAPEPAVVVQNLSGAPDYSQQQIVDTAHSIADPGCALGPVVATVLAYAQGRQAVLTASESAACNTQEYIRPALPVLSCQMLCFSILVGILGRARYEAPFICMTHQYKACIMHLQSCKFAEQQQKQGGLPQGKQSLLCPHTLI